MDKSMHQALQGVIGSQALASPNHVGILVSERLINMPVQVVPPTYRMLADEIKWAIEEVRRIDFTLFARLICNPLRASPTTLLISSSSRAFTDSLRKMKQQWKTLCLRLYLQRRRRNKSQRQSSQFPCRFNAVRMEITHIIPRMSVYKRLVVPSEAPGQILILLLPVRLPFPRLPFCTTAAPRSRCFWCGERRSYYADSRPASACHRCSTGREIRGWSIDSVYSIYSKKRSSSDANAFLS